MKTIRAHCPRTGNSIAHGCADLCEVRRIRCASDGTFTHEPSGPIAEDAGRCAGSVWGEYDRDGFLNLFVATSVGNLHLNHTITFITMIALL